jgi:hypothetical protein
MIDNLAQPTTCNCVIMVGKGLVYPHQTLLDDFQIEASSYAMVMVDMVHEKAKNMKLEVSPEDMLLTLRDAITRMVRWSKTPIDIDPSATASTSIIASQPHTAPGLIFPKPQLDQTQPCPSPIQDQPCLSPPQTQSTPLPALDQTQPPS